MQILLIFLLISGSLFGLIAAVLSHPSAYAMIAGQPEGAADHPESRCW